MTDKEAVFLLQKGSGRMDVFGYLIQKGGMSGGLCYADGEEKGVSPGVKMQLSVT